MFDDHGPVAALIHDEALEHQHAFVEAVGTYAFVWDDNYRLAARVQSSLRDLHASRARILAAADDERRRIERDLHDGGQQRLVALRIRLEMAQDLMGESPARAREMLRRLGDDVEAALNELRSLAAGVYPSLLAARGLTAAIRTAAIESPVPTRVRVTEPTATRPRWRRRRTSAASRRSRTWPSTRRRRRPWTSRYGATEICASR